MDYETIRTVIHRQVVTNQDEQLATVLLEIVRELEWAAKRITALDAKAWIKWDDAEGRLIALEKATNKA